MQMEDVGAGDWRKWKDVESMKDPDMYMEKLPEGIIQSEIALCEAALEKTRS